MQVDTVIGDTAYSGNENLKLAEDEEKGFELISRIHPIISNGFRKEDDKLISIKMPVCLSALPDIWL